jgi:putative nucleotidyltransferase with HDIG domain
LQEQLVDAIEHLRHLVRRFFAHVTATGLSPAEQQRVHHRLTADAAALFWGQGVPDQRHAFDVATRVEARLPGDGEAYVAALLHDVGKRHTRLGAVGRSVATVLDGVGLPMTASMRRYRQHGSIGAAELAEAGMDDLVVAFARDHPGATPPSDVDAVRWQALLDADG